MLPEEARSGSTVGCDLGGTNLKFVRQRRGRIVARHECPTPREGGGDAVVDVIAAGLIEVGARNLRPDRPLAVGVAVPGFLDERRRRVLHVSNIEGVDGYPLAPRLERRLGATIRLDTDSNCGALGEGRLGAGRGAGRLLYVTLGTGLGAALLVDGKPARLSHHVVGHVAHLPLGGRGPRCRCGQPDCAESLLAARGVVSRAKLRPAPRTPRDLHDAALAGDKAALASWAETGRLLGRLLRILVPFVRPQSVVIGGGMAGAARFFLPACRENLAQTLPAEFAGDIDVAAAGLGPYAGAAGAALLPSIDAP